LSTIEQFEKEIVEKVDFKKIFPKPKETSEYLNFKLKSFDFGFTRP